MRLLSTRELSDAIGVSESSLKRWIDAGRITASRTEGGHRRIPLAEAIRFIRDHKTPIVRPEILGVAEIARATPGTRLLELLLRGDAFGARALVTARYLEGWSVAQLADGPIREAMHALGELWRHDQAGVFVEHRGTDACLQAIMQVRAMLPPPSARAPVAIGAAPEGDHYMIPSMLAAMVGAEAGLATVNLGPDTPVPALAAAVHAHKPALVWIAASVSVAPTRAAALVRWIKRLPASVTVVVGGQHASSLANLPTCVRRAATMFELEQLARSLRP